MKFKILHLSILALTAVLIFSYCKKEEKVTVIETPANKGTCSDKIKNQDETDLDCGGVCSACQTCSDGIQNQGETGIDCGGPCKLCPIEYMREGLYGRNILYSKNDTAITSYQELSIAAKLPAGTTLKIGIRNVVGPQICWACGLTSNWSMLLNQPFPEQYFYADGPVTTQVKVQIGGIGGSGTVMVYAFENGSVDTTWRKIVKFKS